MAGINDYIANPEVAKVGQMFSKGQQDQQAQKMNNLEFLIKQYGYQEALKNIGLNDMKRELETGATKFALEHQAERQDMENKQYNLDSEMNLDEQLMRGINDPKTYKRWGEMGLLPKDFHDESGQPLPFEATTEQRTRLARTAIDSTEHVRKKELAEIEASGRLPGYTAADPTNFQRDAGFDATRQFLTDNDFSIGKLTSKDPTDAKQLYRAVTEMTAQLATAEAKRTGEAPNETEFRQKVLDIAKRSIVTNPKNEKAWGPMKWKYTDQIVDWNKFNKMAKEELNLKSSYSSPFSDALRTSTPMFTIKDFAKEKGMTEEEYTKALKDTAKKRNMTVDQVLEELNKRRQK
jgi:hypothetical protein